MLKIIIPICLLFAGCLLSPEPKEPVKDCIQVLDNGETTTIKCKEEV